MALQNHFSTCSADLVSCLLLVLTSCCSIFEIQSRFLRRPCQCHCRVVLVLKTKHTFLPLLEAAGANIRRILNGKHRELSGACSESKWPLLRCRECPLHHLAFLHCAHLPTLLFYTVRFSLLCTFLQFAFLHCALFFTMHWTDCTALQNSTAPTILQCMALHFCSSLQLTGLHVCKGSICTALNCSMNCCKTDPVDLFSELKRRAGQDT